MNNTSRVTGDAKTDVSARYRELGSGRDPDAFSLDLNGDPEAILDSVEGDDSMHDEYLRHETSLGARRDIVTTLLALALVVTLLLISTR